MLFNAVQSANDFSITVDDGTEDDQIITEYIYGFKLKTRNLDWNFNGHNSLLNVPIRIGFNRVHTQTIQN